MSCNRSSMAKLFIPGLLLAITACSEAPPESRNTAADKAERETITGGR